MWQYLLNYLNCCLTVKLRFAMRACKFMDAYQRGLDGQATEWAAKKYQGDCVLPESLMRDLDAANLVKQ